MTFTQKKGRRRTTPSLKVNMWGQEVCRLWAACHLSGRSEVGRQPLPSPHQWRQWPSVLARATCLSFRACFSKCRTRRHWQGWLSSGVLARTNRKLPGWQAAFSPRHFKGCVGGILATFLSSPGQPPGLRVLFREPVAVCFDRPSGQSSAITLPSLFWRFRWKLRCAWLHSQGCSWDTQLRLGEGPLSSVPPQVAGLELTNSASPWTRGLCLAAAPLLGALTVLTNAPRTLSSPLWCRASNNLIQAGPYVRWAATAVSRV